MGVWEGSRAEVDFLRGESGEWRGGGSNDPSRYYSCTYVYSLLMTHHRHLAFFLHVCGKGRSKDESMPACLAVALWQELRASEEATRRRRQGEHGAVVKHE